MGTGKLHSFPLSSVYTWGSGISAPLRLPMLNTEVLQVALGRTQKVGVTKSGRLITWEVRLGFLIPLSLLCLNEACQPQLWLHISIFTLTNKLPL